MLSSSLIFGVVAVICFSEAEEINSVMAIESSPCQDPPLHESARRGQPEDIKHLIQNGEDPYALSCKGESPMEIAIDTENVDMILALVGSRFDLNRRLASGENSVKHALLKKPKLLPLLLKLGGKLEAISEPQGKTLLENAAEDGDVRLALRLIRYGALIDYPNRKSPLERAIIRNQPAMVNFLLGAGANLMKNPLHLAIQSRSVDSLRALLQLGVSANQWTTDYDPPIWEAVRLDFVEAAELLKEFGATLNRSNDTGSSTLLHVAALYGSTGCIEWLAHNGVSVSAANKWGNTPLHYAAYANQMQAVKMLVDLKAPVNSRNNYGQTPLQYAKKQGHNILSSFLESVGSGQ